MKGYCPLHVKVKILPEKLYIIAGRLNTWCSFNTSFRLKSSLVAYHFGDCPFNSLRIKRSCNCVYITLASTLAYFCLRNHPLKVDEKFEIPTREHQMYLSVIFQETIERGIQSGELEIGLDAKAVSQALVVSLIGLTVMIKSRPERSFIDNTIEVTLTLLK